MNRVNRFSNTILSGTNKNTHVTVNENNGKTKSAKVNGRSRSGDPPLRDVTNQVSKNTQATKLPKQKSSKGESTKRPAAVLGQNEEKRKQTKNKDKLKKRRKSSDPMEVIKDEEPKLWEDIDLHDADDPQSVVEYVDDIYEFMMKKELENRPSARYMNDQTDINEKMRAILVDWLVEVHRMFKLLPETLFLTVNIVDRFLGIEKVTRDKLQLVGITAMLIASKFEEIYAPECNDFVYVSDGAYSKEQILLTEKELLNALDFNLTGPSPLHFLRRYSKAAGSDYTIHTLCKYLIELMLIDVKLLKYPPSQIAAGAVYIARMMTSETPLWTPTLEHYTSYPEIDIRTCAVDMNELLKKAQKSSLKAIKKKYALPKYGEVSNIPIVDI